MALTAMWRNALSICLTKYTFHVADLLWDFENCKIVCFVARMTSEGNTTMGQNYRQDPLISCYVPICKNKSMLCPQKHFFPVPLRHKAEWCAAVNKPNVPKGSLYICEDHLDVGIFNYDRSECR